jgi:hypothetical protein
MRSWKISRHARGRAATLAGAALAVVLSGATAHANPLPESEANGSFATGNAAPAGWPPAIAFGGALAAGDVDFFRFTASTGNLVTLSVFDRTPATANDLDTLGAVFNPSGIKIVEDDDDNPEVLSTLSFVATSSGLHGAAVGGFGDGDFNGTGHTQAGDYRLVISTGAEATASGSNQSLASADVLAPGLLDFGALSVEGSIDEDIHFFLLDLPTGSLVTASVFDRDYSDTSTSPSAGADTVLGIFRPNGSLFTFDDDDGISLMSAVHFFADVAGLWGFAVTGFPDGNDDDPFNGDHALAFDYRLVISAEGLTFGVPEPATLGLFGLGLLGLAWTRRRRV